MSPQEKAYHAAYRKRPEVLARDRARKAALRAAPGGLKANLEAVQRTYEKPASYAKKIAYNRRATRDVLGHYAAKALEFHVREVHPAALSLVAEIKREQLLTRRALVSLNKSISAAHHAAVRSRQWHRRAKITR